MIDFFIFRPESDSLKIGDESVVVGLVCASLYKDGDWHRAYIKSMVNLSTVEVFYLDYGTVGQVGFSSSNRNSNNHLHISLR